MAKGKQQSKSRAKSPTKKNPDMVGGKNSLPTKNGVNEKTVKLIVKKGDAMKGKTHKAKSVTKPPLKTTVTKAAKPVLKEGTKVAKPKRTSALQRAIKAAKANKPKTPNPTKTK